MSGVPVSCRELLNGAKLSAATTALIAKLTSDVASILDETARLDCAVWLEEYAVALPALMASNASNVQSYAISGRTVSYRSINEFKNRVAELRANIDAALYGRGGVIDNRLDIGYGRYF